MEVRRLPGFYDEDLEHTGIKGQRWGIRRYQNEDGTLTEAGKARYGRGIRRIQKLEASSAKKQLKAKKFKKKSADKEFASMKAWTQSGSDKAFYKSKKYARKAARLEYSAEKNIKKGKKIYEKLNDEYKGTNLSSIDKSYIDYGKKYAAKYLK